jgi:hypothetical protein
MVTLVIAVGYSSSAGLIHSLPERRLLPGSAIVLPHRLFELFAKAFVTCRRSFGRGGLAWNNLRFALMADPGEWRGRVLASQWVKAREGQPLLASVTMLRWKYDILLDRTLYGFKAPVIPNTSRN